MFIFVFRLDYGIPPSETAIGGGFLNHNQWIHSDQTTVPGQLKVEQSVSALTSDPFHRLLMNKQALVARRGPDVEILGMMHVSSCVQHQGEA